MAAEVMTVFDAWVGENRDPRIVLLNRAINALSEKASVVLITEVLTEEWKQDKKLIPFLEALERLFGKDEIAFREHLRSIITYRFGSDFCRIGIYYEDGPELYIAILAKILKGWNWKWGDEDKRKVSKDAEACFQYFCKAYTETRRLYIQMFEKNLSRVLREHIDNAGFYGKWKFQDLDPWIIRKDTPEAIAATLLHAQIRMTGGALRAREWMKST